MNRYRVEFTDGNTLEIDAASEADAIVLAIGKRPGGVVKVDLLPSCHVEIHREGGWDFAGISSGPGGRS